MKKKVLSVVLALLTTFMMVSATAFAEDETAALSETEAPVTEGGDQADYTEGDEEDVWYADVEEADYTEGDEEDVWYADGEDQADYTEGDEEDVWYADVEDQANYTEGDEEGMYYADGDTPFDYTGENEDGIEYADGEEGDRDIAKGAPRAVGGAEKTQVYVSVANAGELVLSAKSIEVTDADGNGLLTVYDALYCAHEAAFEGGAKAGFETAEGDYGLYLVRLWGMEAYAAYGYYVNDSIPMNLESEVKNGDHVYAFSYADTTGWSDQYGHFDVISKEVGTNEKFTLTLKAEGYDADWNPVSNPVEGAVIFIDGKATSIKTDAEGKAEIMLSDAGEHVISAKSSSMVLTPPVCAVTAKKSVNWVAIGILAVTVLAVIVTALLIAFRRKNAKK